MADWRLTLTALNRSHWDVQRTLGNLFGLAVFSGLALDVHEDAMREDMIAQAVALDEYEERVRQIGRGN